MLTYLDWLKTSENARYWKTVICIDFTSVSRLVFFKYWWDGRKRAFLNKFATQSPVGIYVLIQRELELLYETLVLSAIFKNRKSPFKLQSGIEKSNLACRFFSSRRKQELFRQILIPNNMQSDRTGHLTVHPWKTERQDWKRTFGGLCERTRRQGIPPPATADQFFLWWYLNKQIKTRDSWFRAQL